MAKKQTGLRSTLRRNQKKEEEVSLPVKKELPKLNKDLKEVESTLDAIHPEETAKKEGGREGSDIKEEAKVKTEKPKETKKKDKPIQIKRLTIDMDKKLHKKVKLKCDKDEVSMREYIIGLIEDDLNRK